MKKTNDQLLAEIFTVPPGEAGPHPTNDELAAYAENRDALGAEIQTRLDHHLERCAECAEIVERLIEAESAPQSLPFPVYVPDFDAVRARHNATRSAFGEMLDFAAAGAVCGASLGRLVAGASLALAAAAKGLLPEIVRVDDLLPGFQGEATGDGCAPSEASTIRLAITALESPRPAEVPTGGFIVVWPTGQTEPHGFTHRAGRWRANIRLPLPWPETVALLRDKKIRIEAIPPA